MDNIGILFYRSFLSRCSVLETLRRYTWMTTATFHGLSWLGQTLLLLATEALMSVSTAGHSGLWSWALVLLQTWAVCCFSLIMFCPSVVVELLLLVVGVAMACVSVVLNYHVLFVWDLHGTCELHRVLAPGWVWLALGTLQLLLGLSFCPLLKVQRVRPSGVRLGMVVPVFLRYLGVPLLPQLVFFSLIPVLLLLTLDYILFMKYHSYWYNNDRFNLMLLLEVWSRYWIIRVLVKAMILLHGLQVEGCSWAALSSLLSDLLLSSSESVIGVLGMNAVIAFVAMSLKKHLYNIYGAFVPDLPVLWVLGLQYGLWDLESTQRLERLLQNMYLLMVLGLAGVHCSVHVVLLGLGQSQHLLVPALVLSGFMLYFPVHLTLVFWQLYDWDVWLLTATAFSLHLVLKVLVSLWFWGCSQQASGRHPWSHWSVVVSVLVDQVLGALMVFVRLYSFMVLTGRTRNLLLLSLHCYTHIIVQAVVLSHLGKERVAGRELRLPVVFVSDLWGPLLRFQVNAEVYEDLSPDVLSALQPPQLPQRLRTPAPRGRGEGEGRGGTGDREGGEASVPRG